MSSYKNQHEKRQSSTAITKEEIRDALTGWTDFEEVETTLGPYVSEVIKKAFQQNGYASASEVLDDYKFFHRLVAKFTEGKDMLSVPSFAAEYVRTELLLIKAMMLSGFSAMQSYSKISEKEEKKYISKLLEETDPDELRENTNGFIKKLDTMVGKLKVKNKIMVRVREKLELMPLWKFQVTNDDFKASVRKFEELNRLISDEEKLLELLTERSSTYYRILSYAERIPTYLQNKFYRCLRRDGDKDNLADQWEEVSKNMEALTQKDKEFEQEARRICEMDRLRVLLSSGLKF